MQPVRKIASIVGALSFAFASAQDKAVQQAPAVAKVTEVKTDTLRFYNIHTKERITITRQPGDSIGKDANWFMRDFRRAKPADMDAALFDLLGEIKSEISRRYPKLKVEFHVISGYRAEETNENLRSSGGSQAKKSLHIDGKAMDIRVPGVKTSVLRDIATCVNKGGVGFYASDDFVHVDTGNVRYWPSRDYLKNLKCP